MTRAIRPTGVEDFLGEEELIVSKTDLKGRITYANDVFLRVSKFKQSELIGAPHSLIRHPDMPRCVFKLLWDTLQSRQEIFAYVVNLAKDGSHYWVFAHVTPTFDNDHKIISFHSNRRVPDPKVIKTAIAPLYAEVLREESMHRNGKDALAAGYRRLIDFVASQKVSYDELIFAL